MAKDPEDKDGYRIRLPCDENSFLSDDRIMTEPLFPGQISWNAAVDKLPNASVDMSAYVLRTAAARRRGLHFAFRASYQEQTVEQLLVDLRALQVDIEEVFAALPRRFHFNADNLVLHRNRLSTFILLHVLRHNLFIILGRAALQAYLSDSTKASLVSQARHNRITQALVMANEVSEGLRHARSFDPFPLFEPQRLATEDTSTDPKAPQLVEAITHLLAVIRSISGRSEFIGHLHLEAIYRIMRCDCTHLLNQEDLALIPGKHPLVGQDTAEYDFRDVRGAKLERLEKRGWVSDNDLPIEAPDEVLLDDSPSPTSPRIDRREVTQSVQPSTSGTELLLPYESSSLVTDQCFSAYDSIQEGQPWRDLVEPENADHLLSSLNWLWPFEEWEDQTDNPSRFSSLL
ncbi:hypothetical protein BJX63DRAFT_432772 [Aspergillus granulosus]|uniref:Uncharacterized protein n=1 Tax=Aspergillus granulosus TaxID=176169 RepID=A0ABR4HA28_9EURO